jgi:hypothetical protein
MFRVGSVTIFLDPDPKLGGKWDPDPKKNSNGFTTLLVGPY